MITAWTAATVGQTDEKKAAAIAMANAFGNLSFVYKSYLWPASNAPLFRQAMIAGIIFSMGVIAAVWGLRFILKRMNRKIRESDDKAVNFYVY